MKIAASTWRYRLFATLYLALLFLCVLTYGAAEAPAILVIALASLTALGLAALAFSIERKLAFALAAVLGTLVLLLGWAILQGVLDGGLAQASASLHQGEAGMAFLKIATPFAIYVLGCLIFTTDQRARDALHFAVFAATAIATLSLLQFLAAPGTAMFVRKTAYHGSLTGFFINRNTAATYFGLMAVVAFGMLLGASRSLTALNRKRGGAGPMRLRVGASPFFHPLLYALSMSVNLIALFLTQSRGGILAGLAGFAVTVLLFALQAVNGASLKQITRRYAVAGGLLLICLVAFSAFGERAIYRLLVKGFDDPRFCVLPGMLTGIGDGLPMGHGLGRFEAVFPAYRDPACGLAGVWDKAHSVYLEGAFTIGVAFPVLVAIMLAAVLYICRRGYQRRSSYRFAGPLSAGAVVLVAVHSAFDFSLQIVGFAAIFMAVMAVLTVICLGSATRHPSNGDGAAP